MFTKKQLYIGTVIVSVSASALFFAYGLGHFSNGSEKTLASQTISTAADSSLSAPEAFSAAATNQEANTFRTSEATAVDPSSAEADRDAQKDEDLQADQSVQKADDSQILVARAEPDGVVASRGDERVLPKRTPSGELILEKGVTCDEVMILQENLLKLGYFNAEPTGYFGELTLSAVIKFQKNYGMTPDGQAGPQTVLKIEQAVKNFKPVVYVPAPAPTPIPAPKPTPGTSTAGNVQLLPWFGQVDKIFAIGTEATVLDVTTGLKFRVKRTYGYNHSDTETLTYADTQIMKQVAGGSWNWIRRPAIVEVNGYRIAASFTPMPHAGIDSQPANINVSNRSGDFGYGQNLDSIKGNGIDGHFDIHFYGSKTHGSNSVDAQHQAAIQKAYYSGK